MKQSTTFLSLGYWFSAYSLGLLLHPYKTVRELVGRPFYKPMILVPLVMWGVFWVAAMVGLRFGWMILWILGLKALPRFVNILAFMWWWMTSFMVVWQVLIAYLWVRFKRS